MLPSSSAITFRSGKRLKDTLFYKLYDKFIMKMGLRGKIFPGPHIMKCKMFNLVPDANKLIKNVDVLLAAAGLLCFV